MDECKPLVSGANVPKPITTFEEAAFPDYVLNEAGGVVRTTTRRTLNLLLLLLRASVGETTLKVLGKSCSAYLGPTGGLGF